MQWVRRNSCKHDSFHPGGKSYNVINGPLELDKSASRESLAKGIYGVTANDGESCPAGWKKCGELDAVALACVPLAGRMKLLQLPCCCSQRKREVGPHGLHASGCKEKLNSTAIAILLTS